MTGLKAAIKLAAKNNDSIDASLEPHILTDKPETKILGCRTCKRPCVVTRFASPMKTACKDHRDRHSDVTAVAGEFDRSKETHVLTDREQTKEVPCRSCKRPCVVTTFAAPAKVACRECRTTVPRPRKSVTYKQNGNRMEKVEVTQTFDMEKLMAAVNKPSLPFWPDGSDEDRERLRELASSFIVADLRVTALRAGYLAEIREIKRTDEYRRAPSQSDKEYQIDGIAEEIQKTKDAKIRERLEKQLAKLKETPAQEDLIPAEPDILTIARTERDDAKALRQRQRQHMVDALIEAGVEDPYAEVLDEAAQNIQQIPVREQLAQLEKAGLR